MNADKVILDLCGGTGAWSAPYTENGYTVVNVTLPQYDVRTYNPPSRVYGVLAAPPCTMFSLARSRAKTPRNFEEGMEIVIACLDIIWACRYKNKLAFWALENPVGFLRQFLGKPVMTFHPFEFGDRYSKATDLWGYFNLPKRVPVQFTEEEEVWMQQNPRKLPLVKSIGEITGSSQAKRRAVTPHGFAWAFYKANK